MALPMITDLHHFRHDPPTIKERVLTEIYHLSECDQDELEEDIVLRTIIDSRDVVELIINLEEEFDLSSGPIDKRYPNNVDILDASIGDIVMLFEEALSSNTAA